jgi:hypothetical protein
MREDIQEAINTKNLLLLKHAVTEIPGWSNFIAHTHYQFHKPSNFEQNVKNKNPNDTYLNGVNKREHFYLMVIDANPGFFPTIPKVNDFLNDITDWGYPSHAFSLHNIVGGERPINIHSDPRDSFYWGCQGAVEWEQYDENNNVVAKINVAPGDLLFVPFGVKHGVNTPSPRAAISFVYNSIEA